MRKRFRDTLYGASLSLFGFVIGFYARKRYERALTEWDTRDSYTEGTT